MLDAVQDLGITHREFKRNTHHRINTLQVPVEGIHPWDTVINQTKLLEQEVPSFFQDEVAMREVVNSAWSFSLALSRVCFKPRYFLGGWPSQGPPCQNPF